MNGFEWLIHFREIWERMTQIWVRCGRPQVKADGSTGSVVVTSLVCSQQ